MAITYTCDMCGDKMPNEGIIMVLQHSDTNLEASWDICDKSHDTIIKLINKLSEAK